MEKDPLSIHPLPGDGAPAGVRSRRAFLATVGSAACFALAGKGGGGARAEEGAPWGGPLPAAEDGPAVPPGVRLETIAEAEKLARLSFSAEERKQILEILERHLATYDLLRAENLDNGEGPAEIFDPRLPGWRAKRRLSKQSASRWRKSDPGPLPGSDADIAFAPVTRLGAWIRAGKLTSERLTRIYLERLERLGPQLECVITLTEELALEQARRADKELAAGRDRGPLHGIPWGAKDLLDTRGIRTTWGAEPFKERVADRDAAVVGKLEAAGAVLAAKLTLGALAYGDLWFGGKTRNPWKLEQGSSGSSAGSAAAATAGLAGFTIGTETYGSIASPCARCGATGFRPTFGRVSRAGAMALCWSLDKIGPICRTAEDCALVLDAICGADPADPASVDVPLAIDMAAPVKGMRIGHDPREYESDEATDGDRETLAALRRLGAELVPVELPEGPYSRMLLLQIHVEAAAAFDRLTREDLDDRMRWQEARAWPNIFRRARLIPAVEYMQSRRLRRRFMERTARLFSEIDLFVAPERHGAMHALTNMTGHPALTIRQDFRDDGTPRAVTLWGGLYDDATLLRAGAALERQIGVWEKRPEVG